MQGYAFTLFIENYLHATYIFSFTQMNINFYDFNAFNINLLLLICLILKNLNQCLNH